MARPKKKVEIPPEDDLEDASLFGTLITTDDLTEPQTETIATEPTEGAVTTTEVTQTDIQLPNSDDIVTVINPVYINRCVEIDDLMRIANNEIGRCNAYIFSGDDLALGRIFEMSRKEWSQYYIQLENILNNGLNIPLPQMPEKLPTP